MSRLSGFPVVSATWDAASIADGNEVAVDVTVPGAALGDFAMASLSVDVADLVLSVAVTAANTATAVLANTAASANQLDCLAVTQSPPL